MRSQFFKCSTYPKNELEETFEEMHARKDREFIQAHLLKIKEKSIGIDEVINGIGFSLVHFVASAGDTEALQWLFENGANIYLPISNDYHMASYSALHLASQKNHIETVRFLLEKTDTKVDVSTNDGITALMIAAGKCNEPLVHLLRNHGANVNASYTRLNGCSYTFLEFFLSGGYPGNLADHNLKCAEILLQSNASITEKSMQSVIRNTDLNGLKLLLKYGAVFTVDLLDLAMECRDNSLNYLETRKKDLELKWDGLSDEKRYFAKGDLETWTEYFNKNQEIVLSIESALNRGISLKTI